MNVRRARILAAAAAVAGVAAAAGAQNSAPVPGQFVNAAVESRQAALPLEREIQNAAGRGAVWVAYDVPSIRGRREMCSSWTAAGAPRLLLEPPASFTVLIRLDGGSVARIRTATPECAIDAGGLPVIWLQGVVPAQSVAWLAAQVGTPPANPGNHAILEPALSALAWHAGDDAGRAMIALARSDRRPNVRSRALFWVAQRAGHEAVATIQNAVNNDPETEVKKKAVFALSQLPADQGVPLLIGVARTHQNAQVRKQAMFWLGQSNDARAVSFFEEILTR